MTFSNNTLSQIYCIMVSVMSFGMLLHADVLEKIDVGLAWSVTRTGHPCVDTYGDQQAVSYFDEDHRIKVSQRHLDARKGDRGKGTGYFWKSLQLIPSCICGDYWSP